MRGNPPTPFLSRFSFSLTLATSLLLGACGSLPTAPPASTTAARRPATATPSPGAHAPAMPAAGSGRGGYYQDDGPGDNPPANLLAIPDAEPKLEPLYPGASKPYVVFGKTYTPIGLDAPLKQRGTGSWYGKKFHGQKTSSGERYDMYKMTAAHPTMPLPSYARVTNVANGKQVIVRVNDRGPFHSSRIIDLSYTAAMKLGYLGKGSTELEVERLLPDEIARMEKDRLGERAIALSEPTVTAKPMLLPSELPAPAPKAAPLALPRPDYTQQLPAAIRDAAPTMSVPATTGNVQALPEAAMSGSKLVLLDATTTPNQPTITNNPSSSAAPGFYLQLGAFSQAANAQAVRSRMLSDAAGLPPLEVIQSGATYKLFSGPFSTRVDAADAAQKMLDAGQQKPFIVLR